MSIVPHSTSTLSTRSSSNVRCLKCDSMNAPWIWTARHNNGNTNLGSQLPISTWTRSMVTHGEPELVIRVLKWSDVGVRSITPLGLGFLKGQYVLDGSYSQAVLIERRTRKTAHTPPNNLRKGISFVNEETSNNLFRRRNRDVMIKWVGNVRPNLAVDMINESTCVTKPIFFKF